MSNATIELWSAKRVAEFLGWTQRAVWRYAQLGKLPPDVPVVGAGYVGRVWLASDIRHFKEANGL